MKTKLVNEILPIKLLPAPLDSITETALLEYFETEREPEAKNVLIERNLQLVVKIVRNFINSGASVEDLISVGTMGLIKAINTFRIGEKVKLTAHVSRCVKKEIQTYIKTQGGTP